MRHDEDRNARPVIIVSRVVQAKIFPGAPFIADLHVIYLVCSETHRIAVPLLPVDRGSPIRAVVRRLTTRRLLSG